MREAPAADHQIRCRLLPLAGRPPPPAGVPAHGYGRDILANTKCAFEPLFILQNAKALKIGLSDAREPAALDDVRP